MHCHLPDHWSKTGDIRAEGSTLSHEAKMRSTWTAAANIGDSLVAVELRVMLQYNTWGCILTPYKSPHPWMLLSFIFSYRFTTKNALSCCYRSIFFLSFLHGKPSKPNTDMSRLNLTARGYYTVPRVITNPKEQFSLFFRLLWLGQDCEKAMLPVWKPAQEL